MKSQTSGTNSLLSGVRATLGDDLFSQIVSAKVLVVGSGGIGCELLKNLALSGFIHVHVIDLDTIDVSNLNRQFLFRSHHVGMSKCKVACEVTYRMIPDAANRNAVFSPYHGNVCDNSMFNVEYVKGFNIVLNALDNITARRRVNRICLAASVPLIEAGTTGYLGQVTVIDKASQVECYECQTKPTPTVYPICTIRSTPSMPVHTIVWAKELYKLCFGPKVEDSMLFDGDSNTPTEENPQEEKQASTYMHLVESIRSHIFDGMAADPPTMRMMAGKLFEALYSDEISKQLGMDRFKTASKVPVPIQVEVIQSVLEAPTVPPSMQPGYSTTQCWTVQECIAEALECFVEAQARKLGHASSSSSSPLLPEFDKDDDLAMRFVTSTANLRSYVFHIDPIQSYYSAKGIAGNIIPAIATTNAIVAGLQVLQAFHILKKQMEGKIGDLKQVCRYTYCLRDKTRKGLYLQPTTLPDPNPKCFVCRKAVIDLTLCTHSWTLNKFIGRIIKKELGFFEPSIFIGDSLIYEEGDGADVDAFAANMAKSLSQLPAGGISHGTVIKVEDFSQDLEVDISVSHRDEVQEDAEEELQFTIGGDKPVAKNTESSNVVTDSSSNDTSKSIADDDDDIEIM